MIPKKIHYIWLSDKPLNIVAKKCIESWIKKAPDYEIVRWSMKDFDFSEMPQYVIEAIEQEKWAFACDYLRLFVLYKEGGIYLDSDVLMLKSISELFNHSFVSAIEYYPELLFEHTDSVNEKGIANVDYVIGLNIQAAAMASESHHPFIRACLDYYKDRHFEIDGKCINNGIVAPQIISYVARDFGFKYINEKQIIKSDMILYPSEIIAPDYQKVTEKSVMLHLCNGAWRDMSKIESVLNFINKMKQIYKYDFLK